MKINYKDKKEPRGKVLSDLSPGDVFVWVVGTNDPMMKLEEGAYVYFTHGSTWSGAGSQTKKVIKLEAELTIYASPTDA